MSRPTDGRLARGAQRKESIIAATLAVVEQDGVAGVTHRTVAKQAGVQPSLVAYYFATLDDLLVAALSTAAQEYQTQYAALREAGTDPLSAIARLIADSAGPGRQRALAERELTLLAARRPALRPLAAHWPALVADAVASYTDDPDTIRMLVAASDGICTRLLLAGDDQRPSVDQIRAQLRRIIDPTGT